MIFSCGNLDMFFAFDESAANTSVIPPTRPRYINTVSMSLEAVDSAGVVPSDKPTVPIADAVSNRHVVRGSSSIILIAIPPDMNIDVYSKKIVAALFTASSDTDLPKNCGCSFFLNTDIAFLNRTATVVTFIPPAVEPGAPPISISIISIPSPASLNVFSGTVLNPAVLGVTAWNRDIHILRDIGSSRNSVKKK